MQAEYSDKFPMKTLAFFILFSLLFAGQSYARTVDMTAEQFMKKGIPYCTKKIKRGCVQPKDGNTAKYYLAPKYKEKKPVAKVKTKLKSKSKTLAKKTSLPKYTKSKQSKRDIASVLEQKLKNHRKKKNKK
ncbi:MAG: hypothetical protein K0R29_2376 [Pseudobdellovibrio sp.]|nr:hypothetical protein [Pseudobdellovibrio sp.]